MKSIQMGNVKHTPHNTVITVPAKMLTIRETRLIVALFIVNLSEKKVVALLFVIILFYHNCLIITRGVKPLFYYFFSTRVVGLPLWQRLAKSIASLSVANFATISSCHCPFRTIVCSTWNIVLLSLVVLLLFVMPLVYSNHRHIARAICNKTKIKQ